MSSFQGTSTWYRHKKGEMAEKRKVVKQDDEFVAPDGGWGWMVVLGAGISSMALISILQTFGLIYKDRFEELQFSVTDTTSIMSINSSFGMILGILNGPLLKKFGYRKMAVVGATLFVFGMYCTAFAETYIHFLISYGMISSIGTSVSMSSFSLALNTYFKLKRSIASSFSITIMGMGPIVLPLLITQLFSSYGWRWTVLIITAMTMNTFVGSLLLQPIKWHIRRTGLEVAEHASPDSIIEKVQKETPDSNSLFGYGTSFIDPAEILGKSQSELNIAKWVSQSNLQNSKNYQDLSRLKPGEPNEVNTRHLRSITSLDNDDYGDMMTSTLYILESSTPKKPVKYASVETLGQNSFVGSPYESEKLLSRSLDVKYSAADTTLPQPDKDRGTLGDDAEKRSILQKIFKFIRSMYDLDLFLDPIYINLLIGLSIATVGEIIFSLLTPFILTEMGLSLEGTAIFMSVSAITDVVFRFLSPFVGQFCKLNSRLMYMISISILLLTRAGLFLAKTFTGFMIAAVVLGIGKGFRTVYWTLVVPDYVPLCKLASATAFQSLSNGISLLISGPVIGAIISNNDNKYTNVVYAANFLTFTTIVMWGTEFIIVYHRMRKKKTLPT